MANTIEEILGKSINGIKELREAIKGFQDELVNTEAGTQEWVDTATKLTAAQSKLNEVMQAGKQSVDAAEDSIVGMEKQYKELYNTYKLLSEEQRNSPFGTEMAQQLETLSTKLNETKKGVGNFKDNIGRYADSAVEAFGAMGMSIGGLAGPLKLANGGFKVLNTTMLANPIFWLIAGLKVIIGIFNKVKDAINSNEESQMKLNEAMAAFRPILDAVQNGFDKLGQVVVKIIGFYAEVFKKMREITAAVTDFLGITDGQREKIQKQNALYKELAKSQNELTKAKREAAVLNSEQEAEVKTLLDQAAAESDKEERLRLLNQAKEIQNQLTERNIQLAEEEFRILLETSKLTANDAAMNDKLAAAEAAVNKARAEGAAKTKEMNSQIRSLTESTKSNTGAINKEKEALKDLLKTIDENGKTELQKLDEKYKKEKALLEKYGKSTVKLTEQYEAERMKIVVASQREYNDTIQDLVLNALNGLEPDTSYMKMLFSENEYNRIKDIVNSTAKELNTLAETSQLSLSDVSNVWKKAGAQMGSEYEWVSSLSDAMLVLTKFRKEFKNAEDAYNRMVESIIPQSQMQSALQEKERKILEEKVKLIQDETLTEEEKVKKIEALDSELLQYKANNLLWEIENLQLTNDEKLAKWTEYYAALKTMEDQAAAEQEERKQRQIDLDNLQYDKNMSLFDSNIYLLDSISAISDAISTNIERTMEDGKQSEKTIEKKKKQLKTLQDIQMVVGLAAIAADTAAGIMSIWRGYAMEKVANAETAAATGPAAAVTLAALNAKSLASAIINTTSMGIMAASQMAALISGTISNKKSIDGDSSGGSAGTIAAPAVIETTPYSYTRQIQTTEEEAMLNTPIWVSVTDIENGLNHAKVVQDEASF